MRRFKFIRDPLATELGHNVEEFLRGLGGPIFCVGPAA